MNKIKKCALYVTVMLAISCILPTALLAQGPGFDDDVVDEVPLDGGLSLLAAAGVGYGIKKLKEKKKK